MSRYHDNHLQHFQIKTLAFKSTIHIERIFLNTDIFLNKQFTQYRQYGLYKTAHHSVMYVNCEAKKSLNTTNYRQKLTSLTLFGTKNISDKRGVPSKFNLLVNEKSRTSVQEIQKWQ